MPDVDLDHRLRTLDRIEAPDLWGEIGSRTPRPMGERRQGGRLLAAAVAVVVAGAGIGFAAVAFRGSRTARLSTPAPLELSCRDPKRRPPDPPDGIPQLVASAQGLGEGLGHRVVGHLAVSGERRHRPPEPAPVLPIEELETVLGGHGHQRILHLTHTGQKGAER